MPETAETFALPASLADRTTEDMRLRPLRRLGQLAGEIQNALREENVGLVSQASSLLAPALAQWAEARLPQDDQNAEVAQLTQDAQQALAACEAALASAMSDVQKRQGQVRQHKQRLKQVSARKVVLSGAGGKTLNICK